MNPFRDRPLGSHKADPLETDTYSYNTARMSYGLERSRLGLIARPSETNRYSFTPYGGKVAGLFCRLQAHTFRGELAAFKGPLAALPVGFCIVLTRVDDQPDDLIH